MPHADNVLVRGLENAGAAIGLLPNGENILVKRVIATEGQTVLAFDTVFDAAAAAAKLRLPDVATIEGMGGDLLGALRYE